MKTILLGFCALLTFQCIAQTGKFSLQLTQSTDFDLECGAYNGVAIGTQGAFSLSPKFKLSTGFNFGTSGNNGSYAYTQEEQDGAVTIGWIGRENIPRLDIPLTLHYQFLQKEKFSVQVNIGTRQRFALKRTETAMPDFGEFDFTAFRAFSISTNMELENSVFELVDFPDMSNFEPIGKDIILVQEKGYNGLDAFVGLGANYHFSPLWSVALNANFNFFATHKHTQIVDNVEENWSSSCFEMGDMRLGLSLVRQF